MAEEQISLVIFPVLYLGIIIGLYELFVIHSDVGGYRGSRWIGHGLQSILFVVIALFITMNAAWAYSYFSFLNDIAIIKYPIALQIVVGMLLMIKIHLVSAVVKGGYGYGMRMTWIHGLIIGALIVIAPYIWPFIEPAAKGVLPGI